MSSLSNAVPIPKEKVAVALAWGTSPRLYLSYGMVAMKGMHPVLLTDDVEAAPSFTVMSPPMGLDFFAVLDSRGLGATGAGGESNRLLALLRDAVARQFDLELLSDSPRFLDKTSGNDVVGWWTTSLRKAFRAFHDEVAACSQGEDGVDVPAAATAIVALVLERYLVIGNCGASKAVISRDGEIVELSSDSEHMANKGDQNKSVDNAGGDGMGEATSRSKLATSPRTTSDASVSSAPALPLAAAGVVDVVAVKREPRDEFLILASAALWVKVTPAAACAHVRLRLGRTFRVTDVEGSTTLLAEELAWKAVHAGSRDRDNVSVVLVVFKDFWATGVTHTPTPATPSPGAEVLDEGRDEAIAGSAGGRRPSRSGVV